VQSFLTVTDSLEIETEADVLQTTGREFHSNVKKLPN
jgi:hypothetical protein